jgi:hypothetical protein
MANSNLGAAKKAKNDEFYTQYHDIEKEMNAYLDFNQDVFRDKIILLPCDDPEWSNFTKYFAQNFDRLGLRKLISTSFAPNSKPEGLNYQPTLFEFEDPKFDEFKTKSNGKIFTLERTTGQDEPIDVEDLKWNYLKGDGDFLSDEIKAIRDSADIVITNPPFSLFRQFLSWILEGGKDFVILGNMNALTYKEVFPHIRDDRMWLGATNFNLGMYFFVPEGFQYSDTYKFEREIDGKPVNRVPGVCWFTSLDHGRRHQPMILMTEAENIRFSKHKEVKNLGYLRYDNYDAIEVPFADSIPSDHPGVMGVPISFLGKYSPEQFEILGMAASAYDSYIVGIPFLGGKDGRPLVNGKNTYARIMIRHKKVGQ